MDLKEITKYRNVWMALAILWVVFFHSELRYECELINYIKLIGYGGVDIFVFASGFGCYVSLTKNENIYLFYKKRIKKIIPMYWIVLVPWIVFKIKFTGITFYQIIANIFCVQGYIGTGNDFNWYISAMWFYYFLIPFFYIIIKRIKSKSAYILMFVVIILFSLSFLNSYNLIVMMTRIPVLFLGVYTGKLLKEERKIGFFQCTLLLISSVVGCVLIKILYEHCEELMWPYGLWWYPFILITPGICILVSVACIVLEKCKIGQLIIDGLKHIGNHTFEIYLIHILFFETFKYCANKGYVWNCNRNWYILMALTAIASVLSATIKKFAGRKIEKFLIHK